jgi:hypothetical protein
MNSSLYLYKKMSLYHCRKGPCIIDRENDPVPLDEKVPDTQNERSLNQA